MVNAFFVVQLARCRRFTGLFTVSANPLEVLSQFKPDPSTFFDLQLFPSSIPDPEGS